MGQIIYKINTGTPNFTVHIEPSVSPDQVQTALGTYAFTGITTGTYSISIIDSNGCFGFKNNIIVGSNALEITFNDITYADLIIDGSSSNVTDWNTFFSLPSSGTSFTNVTVTGNTVLLFGGAGIKVNDSLFSDPNGYGANLISFVDNASCITSLGYNVFGNDSYFGCTGLTTVSLPACTSIGSYYNPTGSQGCAFCGATSLINVNLPSLIMTAGGCNFCSCTSLSSISLPLVQHISNSDFNSCTELTSINLPSCIDLGANLLDNSIFTNISGNNITLTVPEFLMYCNNNTPDGDIQTLQSNNTVTVLTASATALNISFIDISYADLIISGSSSNVSNWNTYFNLPSSGKSFDSVKVFGNTVSLYGGSGITLSNSFENYGYGSGLIRFIDNANCIIGLNYDVFGADNYGGCTGLTTVSLPACTSIGEDNMCCTFSGTISLSNVYLPSLITLSGFNNFTGCIGLTSIYLPLVQNIVGYTVFDGCTGLTTIYIPSCTNLGPDVGNNNIFAAISGNNITLTVPSALMTCDSGNPDGDIVALQGSNTVTVVTV